MYRRGWGGAIADIVTCLRDNNDYTHIENLWVNNGNSVVKNPMRQLVQDLDSLPFPAYGRSAFSFIDSDRNTSNDLALLDSYLWIQSSRGCPYVCSYCVNSMLRPLFNDHGNYTRRRSVDSIIREMKESLSLSGITKEYVYFVDEVFGGEESWLDEFVLRYKEEIGVAFLC